MAQVRKPKSQSLANLGDLVVIEPVRTEGIDLTPEERAFLDDPGWITEDEADAIMSQRIMRSEGHKARDIHDYLKERGIEVED
jgi:hypothetical protein